MISLELFKLFGSIFLKDEGVEKKLDGIDKKAGGLGGTFGKVTGAIGLLGGAVATAGAAVGGWKWFVSSNAQMEQYKNTLGIVLKDTTKAAETLDWATNFAAKTPFEIPDIVDATTRLSAYGIKAQDVLGNVGDMASALGKPLMQAVEAVADAQTGELERLKEFGITKQMLIDKAKDMGMQEIVNAKGQITNMEGMNTALMTLIKDRYNGAMEIQSTSLNGMISNLTDWLGTAGRVMGEGIFGKVKDALGGVLGYLNQLTESGKLEEWATNIGNVINVTVDGLGILIGWIGQLIGWLKTWAMESDSTGGSILQTFQWLFADIQYALTGFIEYFKVMWSLYGTDITNIFKNIWNLISTILKTALNLLTDIFHIFGALFRGDWAEVWQGIKFLVSDILDGLINIIKSALDLIKSIFKLSFDQVKNIVLYIFDGMASGIKGFINIIIGAVNTLIAGLNKVKFSVPSWVPGVGGNSWGINISKIPMLAKGGNVLDDGSFIAGENGAELISNAKGARVTPLDKLGGGINININNPVIMDDYGVDRMMDRVMERLALSGVV